MVHISLAVKPFVSSMAIFHHEGRRITVIFSHGPATALLPQKRTDFGGYLPVPAMDKFI